MNEELIKELINACNRISEAITNAAAPKTNNLGFSNFKNSEVIFVGANENGNEPWYYLAENEKQYIPFNALTGYLVSLESKETTRKVGRNEVAKTKFIIEMKADKNYYIWSGMDFQGDQKPTAFTKSFLLAINLMPLKELLEPMTLLVTKSEETDNVVFCNIYNKDKQMVWAISHDLFDKHTFETAKARLSLAQKKQLSLSELKLVAIAEQKRIAFTNEQMKEKIIALGYQSSKELDEKGWMLLINELSLIPTVKPEK